MDLEEYSDYVNKMVYPTISKVSLVLATIVVLTMILLTIYDFKLVDRVTLRLQTGVILYDIWLHSLPLWNRPYNKDGSPLCTFIAYQLLFFPLYYSFLNAAIGINLQLVFLHNISVTWKVEAGYWIGAILLTLLITIPPLAKGMLGFSKIKGCYLATNDESYYKVLDFYSNILVLIVCMSYLLIVVVLVAIKLRRGLDLISDHRETIDNELSSEAIKKTRLLISRVTLYPIIMIVSHIGLVINESAYDLANFQSPVLDILLCITGGMLGTLNFIAFFLDPTVHHALKVIYWRTIKNQEIEEVQSINLNTNRDFELTVLESGITENLNNEREDQRSIISSNLIKSL